MRRGLTLIEPLVVIAIIVVLGTFVIVAFNSAARALKPQCRPGDDVCDCRRYADFTVRVLPAKCLKYYGINNVLTQ